MEELAFWIFLIHLKDTSPTWFKSRFFQAFIMLSILSIGIMVCIVSVLKPNVMLTEGVLMTVATGFNTLITCAFFWVFSKFPSWLRDLTKRSAVRFFIIFESSRWAFLIYCYHITISHRLLNLPLDFIASGFDRQTLWIWDFESNQNVLSFDFCSSIVPALSGRAEGGTCA